MAKIASKADKVFYFPDNLTNVFGEMLQTKENSDVVFVVNETRLPAHRLIVAAHSKFFKVLLFKNRFKEGEETEIPLQAPEKAFQMLLAYFYTGLINLTEESFKTAMELYELAHRYEVSLLEEKLQSRLIRKITVGDVFDYLNFIALFESTELETKFLEYIDKNAQEILDHEKFLALNENELKKIIERQTLKVTTIQKFEALDKWIKHNKIAETVLQKKVLDLIDISKLSNAQILKIVAPTNLYDPNLLLSTMASRESDVPEEQLPVSSAFINVPKCIQARTLHSATDEVKRGSWAKGSATLHTFFSMESACMINVIDIQLGSAKGYGFTVETSINSKDWEKVYTKTVDHFCKDIQIFVAPRPVKHFRISGQYEIVAFKTWFKEGLKFVDGVYAPSFKGNNPPWTFRENGLCSTSLSIDGSSNLIQRLCLIQPLWLKYIRFQCNEPQYCPITEFCVKVIGKDFAILSEHNVRVTEGAHHHFISFPPNVVTAFEFSTSFIKYCSAMRLYDFEAGN